MKKSIILALVAAMPLFAQEAAPAPVAAPAPQVDAKAAFIAKYDADKDGKISAQEAHAAKADFLKNNREQFAGKKPGMRHGKHQGPKAGKPEGRRPRGPQFGGPKAPKAPKAPKCGKTGVRRPMGPQFGGQQGPKAPK